MPEKWKCTVCGYQEEGTTPPRSCPRCGTDSIRFIPKHAEKFNLPRDMAQTFILHAAAAHFPTGLVPSAFLFLLLALLLQNRPLESSAFFLLLLSLAVIPVSLASGVYDWQTKYQGARARIFYKKIVLAISLLVLAGMAGGIRFYHPDVFVYPGFLRIMYLCLVGAMLAVTVLLGHYGGKLAFQWKNRKI